MHITLEQKTDLENIYQSFLRDERILKMKEIEMHRGSNCYIHSFKVAKLAIKRTLRHHKIDINIYTVLFASILHDYYLYDWRKDRSKMKHHMSNHPYVAAENAFKDFSIHEPVRKAIESHMWPVNIGNYPRSIEATIVSNADKTIYIREISCSRKYKTKREQKYLKQISTLFDE